MTKPIETYQTIQSEDPPVYQVPKPVIPKRSPYVLATIETAWPLLMAVVIATLLYVLFSLLPVEAIYFITLVLALTMLITSLTLLFRSNLKRIKKEQQDS